MSSFACARCGLICSDDGPRGYISGCEHYPVHDEVLPEIQELITFTRQMCGHNSPEYWLVLRLIGACERSFTDEEVFLLMFLTEAWRWREVL